MNQNGSFNHLFFPRAIALVGVNKAPYGASYFFRILVRNKVSFPLYPVNPKMKGEMLQGYKVYESITALPEDPPIDLVIIAVPAKVTPAIIKEMGQKKIPYAHIFTSGYSEVGDKNLENELLAIARQNNVRIIGPNCLGIYNPQALISFVSNASMELGNVGFICQSGGLGIRFTLNGPTRGFNFSKIISVGNQIDLDMADFIRYFKDDPATKLIGLYLENIKKDGRGFFHLLRETTATKPIVLWKGGVSARGNDAVQSHTGGLAGDFRIWEGVAKQTGLILVNNFQELVETIQALSIYKIPITKSIAIITAGGGVSIEGTDEVDRAGLEIPLLSKQNQQKILKFIPEVNTNVANPLDLGGTGLNTTSYAETIKVLEDEPSISNIFFEHAPELFPYYAEEQHIADYEDQLIKNIVTAKSITTKNIICIPTVLKEDQNSITARHQFRQKLQQHGIMTFDSFAAAAKCCYRLWQYGQYLEKSKNKR